MSVREWVTLDEHTGAGVVNVPETPGEYACYAQRLEWAGLLSLRNEIRRTGGRTDVVNCHVRACVEYERRWGVASDESTEP